jgi:hypothetical protein
MVSFFHHLRTFHDDNKIDFGDMARTGWNLYPGKWHEHVTAWQSNPYNAEVMILKYEDLLAAPVKQLVRTCQFLAITRSFSDRSVIQFLCSHARKERCQIRSKEG